MPLLLATALLLACPFGSPLDGPVVRDYAPAGSYGGHWGVDIGAEIGTPFHPLAPGRVSFAGEVAGRLSVTIDHGGGVRSSYSYLSAIAVESGQDVTFATVLGRTGADHGIGALHVSLRIGADYVRPTFGTCSPVPALGLSLSRSRPVAPYPFRRATRHPRRHLRPSSYRPSRRGRDGLPRVGARRGDVHPGWCAVAEGRP